MRTWMYVCTLCEYCVYTVYTYITHIINLHIIYARVSTVLCIITLVTSTQYLMIDGSNEKNDDSNQKLLKRMDYYFTTSTYHFSSILCNNLTSLSSILCNSFWSLSSIQKYQMRFSNHFSSTLLSKRWCIHKKAEQFLITYMHSHEYIQYMYTYQAIYSQKSAPHQLRSPTFHLALIHL